MYWFAVRNMGTEDREKFDNALRDMADAYDEQLKRTATHDRPATPVRRPGMARTDIKRPKFWKGDREAFRSSVGAARQLGEPAARQADGPSPPTIGTGR